MTGLLSSTVAMATTSNGNPPMPDALEHSGTFWMPDEASTMGEQVDWLYHALVGLSIFWFVVIAAAVVILVVKYRARPGYRAQKSPSHHNPLEIAWTVVPSIIVAAIFVLGWKNYVGLVTAPPNALEIKVTAQKWSWSFTHAMPDGRSLTDAELHVPAGQPVRLTMTSMDVIHSLFIPAFRVKQDVVPARYTYLWFEADRPGEYRIYCAEYCGKDHSNMKTRIVVHEPRGYRQYLETRADELMTMTPAELGELLYQQRCVSCHSSDGSLAVGPTFRGLFGKTEALQSGPRQVDENYLRESIVEPMKEIVAGYPPIMPTFKGQLSDRQIDAIIEYIKGLR